MGPKKSITLNIRIKLKDLSNHVDIDGFDCLLPYSSSDSLSSCTDIEVGCDSKSFGSQSGSPKVTTSTSKVVEENLGEVVVTLV